MRAITLTSAAAGCAAVATSIAVPLSQLDEPALLAVAAVPAAGAAGLLLYGIGGRLADWRRYRHNTARALSEAELAELGLPGLGTPVRPDEASELTAVSGGDR
ncbi:hypothetical protein [Paractinoplanes atraurantiacus]|uniref:Uncharacterized protein n=1 Tax=Paractinoplanes atraurantiacus TaxID=1036182 RepID=A0A285KLK9_9ACTN|nr:hypothetical protein [Actinoplanes atraurantiacus]SNY72757.1 hypothetical protein SAMN05421748_1446 [Actinoplanes atraurantiacus]